MSDFIYPECPECGTKASEGEGLSLAEVMVHRVEWHCPDCGEVCIGQFIDGDDVTPHMNWLMTRQPTWYERIVQLSKTIFGR